VLIHCNPNMPRVAQQLNQGIGDLQDSRPVSRHAPSMAPLRERPAHSVSESPESCPGHQRRLSECTQHEPAIHRRHQGEEEWQPHGKPAFSHGDPSPPHHRTIDEAICAARLKRIRIHAMTITLHSDGLIDVTPVTSQQISHASAIARWCRPYFCIESGSSWRAWAGRLR
jgi:hypothetical protein